MLGLPSRQLRSSSSEAVLFGEGELAQPAVAVDAVHEHVAAVGQSGQLEFLPFEEAVVVVAVADGDALADLAQVRIAQAAAAPVELPRGGVGQEPRRDRVAVAEAEPRLPVVDERLVAAGPAELVPLEPEEVPVPMVARAHVAELADGRLARRGTVVGRDHLVGAHADAGAHQRTAPVDDQRAAADVPHGRAEAEPVGQPGPSTVRGDAQLARCLLVEVGQVQRRVDDRRRLRGARVRQAQRQPRRSEQRHAQDEQANQDGTSTTRPTLRRLRPAAPNR